MDLGCLKVYVQSRLKYGKQIIYVNKDVCLYFDKAKFEKMYHEYRHSDNTSDSSECEIEIFKILVNEIQNNKININDNSEFKNVAL